MSVLIIELYIYPIKSLAGVRCHQVELDSLGLKGDRRYMLVDGEGRFVTQRGFPQMSQAQVTATDQGWIISLPQMGERLLPEQGTTEQHCDVEVWGDQVQAFDQGDEWAAWFSAWLQAEVRLVYLPEQDLRRIDENYCPQAAYVSFADGFPILLISDASLQQINSRLSFTIGMERFRPNLVVTGCKPFAEDGWQNLTADDLQLDVVKPCSRCVIPTIDPATSERQPEVWKALAGFRKGEDGSIYVGQNLLHSWASESARTLMVGQQLSVTEKPSTE